MNESIVEDGAFAWFADLRYAVGHAPELAPGEPTAEQDSFGEVVLIRRLHDAIRRLNSTIPGDAREEALRKVLRVGVPSLTQANRGYHRMRETIGIRSFIVRSDLMYAARPGTAIPYTIRRDGMRWRSLVNCPLVRACGNRKIGRPENTHCATHIANEPRTHRA